MREGGKRYVPDVEGTYAGWHHACVAAGAVCVQRCEHCGGYQHPPRETCPRCGWSDLTYEQVERTGVCYSFTVTHSSRDKAWSLEVPFATVVIELPQGVRLIAGWDTEDGRSPEIGEGVDVTVEVIDGRFAFLWGRPCL